MDWANVTKIHTSLSAKRFPPLMSMHYTKTISRPGQECILAPQASLGVLQLSRKFEYHQSHMHKAFVITWQGEGGKNSQHKFTMMVNSQV